MQALPRPPTTSVPFSAHVSESAPSVHPERRGVRLTPRPPPFSSPPPPSALPLPPPPSPPLAVALLLRPTAGSCLCDGRNSRTLLREQPGPVKTPRPPVKAPKSYSPLPVSAPAAPAAAALAAARRPPFRSQLLSARSPRSGEFTVEDTGHDPCPASPLLRPPATAQRLLCAPSCPTPTRAPRPYSTRRLPCPRSRSGSPFPPCCGHHLPRAF